jgi:hypothetical protein
VKNTVGEIFLRGSRLPTGDDNTNLGRLPMGFARTGRVGLCSAILGCVEMKQRREPVGPVGREMGRAQERVKGGWAGLGWQQGELGFGPLLSTG